MSKRLAMLDSAGVVINLAIFEDSILPDGVTTIVPSRTTRVGDRVVGGVLVEAPTPIPEFVSKLQLVRSMRLAGVFGDFKSRLKQASAETKEDWDYASDLYRDDSMTEEFRVALTLSQAQMDDIFIEAVTL